MSRNILKNVNLTPSDPAASSSDPGSKSFHRKAGSLSTDKTAVSKGIAQKNIDAQCSKEQVALRAYFIGERRRNLGLRGDETSDWLEAEREISEELDSYQFATRNDDRATVLHHHTGR